MLDAGLRARRRPGDARRPAPMSRPTRGSAGRLTEHVELFVAGNNLLHRTHAESNDPGRAQLAERSVYAGARLRF